MGRIDKKDRLKFARQAQKDFETDYNYIDIRMFTDQEFTAWLTARKSPEDFVKYFEKIEKGVYKE